MNRKYYANKFIDSCGGTAEIARAFRKKSQTVSMWRKNGVPEKYIPQASKMSGIPIEKFIYGDI